MAFHLAIVKSFAYFRGVLSACFSVHQRWRAFAKVRHHFQEKIKNTFCEKIELRYKLLVAIDDSHRNVQDR